HGEEFVVAWLPLHREWGVELFAEPVPVARQYACLHLLVEARLLVIGGEGARGAVPGLEIQGEGAEPAFAADFGIEGNPYEELARLADASDDELRRIASRAL